MKKQNLFTIAIAIFLCSFAFGKETHITNYNLRAYTGTDFAQSTNNVYFIDSYHRICSMNKSTWNGHVIIPSNGSARKARPETGLLWSNERLYYIADNNRIYYFKWSSTYSWQIFGPFSASAHSQSDLTESTNNIYYVGSDSKVRSMSKSTLTSGVIINNAPLAKPGTDLLWKDNKLFYVAQNNRIYYFYWTSGVGWQIEGHVGNSVNPSSNLTASNNNIYYIDVNNYVRSMGIGNNGSWWYNHVIDYNAPKAKSGSDLKWIDNKLFYISEDNAVCYFVWNRINSWESCEFFKSFKQDVIKYNGVFKWAEIHTNSNFFEASNKQVLFVENEGNRIYYFRAPLNLQVVNNPISKSGWNLVSGLSAEFNSNTLNTSNWLLRYPYYNHPMETNSSNGERFSLYYNAEDQSNHITSLSTLKLRTAYGSFSETCYNNSEDINDASNGGTYSFKSAMLYSKSSNSITHGYFEIRCKVVNTSKEKYCFWLYTGGQEIDVFETTGIGDMMPTNYHEFYNDSRHEGDSDGYGIYCLNNQHLYDNFYTYAVEWDDEKIIWYLNNQVVRVVHKDQNYPKLSWPSNPISVIITTRVWDHYNDEPFNFPNDWEIDYVRVYQKSSTKSASALRNDLSQNQNVDLKIYPNPSNGIVNIEAKDNSSITIFDVNGRIIHKQILKSNNSVLNLNDLDKGVYFISIGKGGQFETRKLIIQ